MEEMESVDTHLGGLPPETKDSRSQSSPIQIASRALGNPTASLSYREVITLSDLPPVRWPALRMYHALASLGLPGASLPCVGWKKRRDFYLPLHKAASVCDAEHQALQDGLHLLCVFLMQK